jgi:hypothetical protein
MKKSGDRKSEFIAEARSRGEELAGSDTGLYQGTRFSRAVKDKNTWALARAVFRRMFRAIGATLREIFDESAYDRFLMRTRAPRTAASYRQFTQERDAAMLKKPRCC